MSHAASSSSTNPFWTFSLDLYASKSVQEACIALQDRSGVDVNVMLYILWLAAHGQTLSDADLRHILATVEPWKAGVVVPLRTARRTLKTPPAGFEAAAAEALRAVIKKAELESERLQQTTLFRLQSVGTRVAPTTAVAAGTANLQTYGRALGHDLEEAPVGVMLTSFEALLANG